MRGRNGKTQPPGPLQTQAKEKQMRAEQHMLMAYEDCGEQIVCPRPAATKGNLNWQTSTQVIQE